MSSGDFNHMAYYYYDKNQVVCGKVATRNLHLVSWGYDVINSWPEALIRLVLSSTSYLI